MILLAYDAPMNPYGPAIDQINPYKGTLSGEREHQKPSYRIGPPSTKNPILTLQDDIVGFDGRGLKKGFYEVKMDEEYDFFLLIQSGKLKAKIPVLEVKNIKDNPPVETEIKKIIPKKIKKEREKEEKRRKKREYKYRKGELPEDYVHSKAELFYDKSTDNWVIIWELENTRAIGSFKI